MGLIEAPSLFVRRRISVDEYYRMAEIGLLRPTERVELIRGEIINMAPIGTRHAGTVNHLNRLLSKAVGAGAILSVQNPLWADGESEPEPDLMVLKPRADSYRDAHPRPGDVLLLVEVSDTSARYDREIKLPLYASIGIPEVWIVDLDSRLFRRHREPVGDEYVRIDATAAPGVCAIGAMPGVDVDLTGVLG